MLTLFLIQRAPKAACPVYDTMRTCVVAAPDGEAARRIASEYSGDEGAQVWHDASTTATVIGHAVDGLAEGLVCRNFFNG